MYILYMEEIGKYRSDIIAVISVQDSANTLVKIT